MKYLFLLVIVAAGCEEYPYNIYWPLMLWWPILPWIVIPLTGYVFTIILPNYTNFDYKNYKFTLQNTFRSTSMIILGYIISLFISIKKLGTANLMEFFHTPHIKTRKETVDYISGDAVRNKRRAGHSARR